VNWPRIAIGELCTLKTGGTPRTSVSEYYENGTVPWIVSGDIHKGEIYDCVKRITEYAVNNSNARYLPKDSVLIALNGQGKTRGTVALLRMNNATCNQSVVSIASNDKEQLCTDFLFYYLKSQYKQIRGLTGDKDRAGLNMPLIRGIKIPLPTLNEQNRIVALLNKAHAIRCKREQAIQLADEFVRSVFLDMFGDPITNSQGWDLGSFVDICELNPKPEKCDDELEVSFVPMANVSQNSHILDATDIKKYANVKKGFTSFKENDVLFAKITPCMENGKAAIASMLRNKVGFGSTEFHVFRPLNSDYSVFIYSLLHLPVFRTIAASNFSGAVGHKRVPKDFLLNFALILPPESLVMKYKSIFDLTWLCIDKLKNSERRDEELFNSLSQKAFAGEL
jgi:restriction endonuclease S subunit